MNPENIKCSNCRFWQLDGIDDSHPNEDFHVEVGRCLQRGESYTDEFYYCEQFELKE